MYIAFDPGLTTGVAYFNEKGETELLVQIKGIEEFYVWLHTFDRPFDYMIYEAYVINPKVDHGGDEVPAAQIIGIIRGFAYANEKILIKQLAYNKVPGYTFLGKKYVKGKKTKTIHQEDAESHGAYYLVKNRIMKPKEPK